MEFHDSLGSFSDAEIARLHTREPLTSTTQVGVQQSHELFVYARYDWKGFKANYAVIKLTQGYFAIVDKEDARRILRHKWYANVQRDHEGRITKVYAARTRAIKGKNKKQYVYLHRFVINAGERIVVDHKHGLTLDCRKGALKATNHGGNTSNGRSNGPNGGSLKRGVELRFQGSRYGAQIKLSGKTKRSKKTWPLTPDGEEAAHQWYLREHQKAFSHRGLPELGVKAKYPLFPPLKQAPVEVPYFVLSRTPVVVDDISATF